MCAGNTLPGETYITVTPAQVGTPIHQTLLYAKMFFKMGLAFSYTYRATETEPTEHRIEKKEMGLKRPQDAPPQCKVN